MKGGYEMTVDISLVMLRVISLVLVGFLGMGLIKRNRTIAKISVRMNNIISLSQPTYSSNITRRGQNNQ